jgi:hypothetical protein
LLPKKSRPKVIKYKDRDLKYASHRDAQVYAYYANDLSGAYENLLAREKLGQAVVGYRSGLGSNVDTAARAFSEISARGECVALCFDLKNFFPTIPHRVLKFNLSEVLGVNLLPKDWYNLFRSMSRFSWIDIEQLFFWCLIDPKVHLPRPLCADPAVLLEDLRSNNMIHFNRLKCGIPQGAPISALLANVAMLQFDRKLARWAEQTSSVYMRYSDDILVITEPDREDEAHRLVKQAVAEQDGCMQLSDEKTEICTFTENGTTQTSTKPLTYLGFTFDGANVRLRDRTLSRYYRRMTYATRGTAKAARQAIKTGGSGAAYKRRLFTDFTHLGNANFYRYATKAQSKFGGVAIRKQLKRHFVILLRKLENRGK